MKYSITVDKKSKIIYYRHTGIIKKEDLGMAWEEFLKMKEFAELGYNLCSDYRNSTFSVQVNDINEVCDLMVSFKPFIEGKKQSLILDNGYSTALSVLFVERVYARTGFQVKIFSTKDAAVRWLLK